MAAVRKLGSPSPSALQAMKADRGANARPRLFQAPVIAYRWGPAAQPGHKEQRNETLFVLAFARDLPRAHRTQSQGPRAPGGGGCEPHEGRAAREGLSC